MRNRMNIGFLLFVLLVFLGGLFFLKGKKAPEVPVPPSVYVSDEKKVETEKKEEKKEEKKKVVKKKRVVKRDAEGWLPYMRVGRNPYAKFRTPDKDLAILEKRGYTKEEVDEYIELREKGKGSYRSFFKDTKFLWVVFGNARVVEKLRAVWNVPAPGMLYQLQSGRNVVVLDECENLAEVAPRSVEKKVEVILPLVVIEAEVPKEVPQVVEEEKPQPLVVEALPPVVEVPLLAPPVVEEKKEEVNCFNSLKKWDPNLFIGHEREPKHSGNWMEATDLSAALYCLWQTEDPNVIHGLGPNFKGSLAEGRVNHGDGKWTSYLLAGGSAYKRIQKDKWDMELRLLFGVLHERFREGGYQNHRENLIVGPSFIFNDYRRRSQGHKWFHETQWYIELLFPFASDLSHSWEGKPLAGDPDNLNVRLFVGVKEWLYDNKLVQPYFQAGFFWEDPLAMSATLRLGIAVPNRWLGIGIGPDFDLKNGGTVLGWGPWIDVTTGLRDLRRVHRASQMTDVTGIGDGVTTSPDGFIMVPVGEDVSSSSSSSGQNPNEVYNGNTVGSPNLDGPPIDK